VLYENYPTEGDRMNIDSPPTNRTLIWPMTFMAIGLTFCALTSIAQIVPNYCITARDGERFCVPQDKLTAYQKVCRAHVDDVTAAWKVNQSMDGFMQYQRQRLDNNFGVGSDVAEEVFLIYQHVLAATQDALNETARRFAVAYAVRSGAGSEQNLRQFAAWLQNNPVERDKIIMGAMNPEWLARDTFYKDAVQKTEHDCVTWTYFVTNYSVPVAKFRESVQLK